MVETTAVVLGVLVSFTIAIAVRFLSARTAIPYTVLLVAVGFGLTILPLHAYLEFSLDPLFTHDVILFVFLPAIVFQGAAEIDHARFLRNLPVVGTTVLVGLPLAVLSIGWLGSRLFGIPLLVALLFGAMAYPIDPVAVLSLFEGTGTPDRLAVLVEGESLLDDGLAIVVFSAVLELVRRADPAELGGWTLFSPGEVAEIAGEFLVVSVGGVLIGLGVGYATYMAQRSTDDRATLFMITFVAAYGSFYLGEHALGVSEILATVATGLVLGVRSRRYALSGENLAFLAGIWERIVFLLETLLFVAIGIEVSSTQVLAGLPIVLATLALLVGVRAGVVYGITNLLNRVLAEPVPMSYQHVVIWGGMHGVIPIALALSLGPDVPFADRLRTAVFGVVVASVIVQGVLMPRILEVTGVASSCVAEP